MPKLKQKVEPRQATHPLVRLQRRLFSGQYVKLRKLSRERIAGQLGCSVAEYLGEEDMTTVSHVLGDEEDPGVTPTPNEEALLSQLVEKEPPLPPERPRLKCAFCEEEFYDVYSRVQHHLLHTSGQIETDRPRPSATYNCHLCTTRSVSAEERREHYLTAHFSVSSSTSTTSVKAARIPCKHPSCSMDFGSEAQSTNHYLTSHKLKDSYFHTSRLVSHIICNVLLN